MAALLSLCDELLHEVFTLVDPPDLSSLARTCRTFNAYIKGNKILWKDSYFLHHDNPPQSEGVRDWEQELQDISRMERILRSDDVDLKRQNITSVIHTAINFIERANKSPINSSNIRILQKYFESPTNRDVFLFSSSLYGHNRRGEKLAGTDEQNAAAVYQDRQLSAKFHTYFGTKFENHGRSKSRLSHPYARARVYDLRHYNDRNSWGPYRDDRSFLPDWEKIEAIMIDLGYNMQRFVDGLEHGGDGDVDMYDKPFEGVTPDSYTPIKEFVCPGMAAMIACGQYQPKHRQASCPHLMGQPDIPLDARDPYGISGTWRRVVCFLDFHDLYAFNFLGSTPRALDEMRQPITTTEAIRLITMKIRVSAIEEPGEGDGKGLPVVHFTGTSRSMHASWDPNANSRLAGSVRLTPHGDVRWTTLSIFHGEARWRSESIQLGGIRSARGVIGTWFDKDYDPNGPAGPTAFWKVCDQDQGHVWDDEDDD